MNTIGQVIDKWLFLNFRSMYLLLFENIYKQIYCHRQMRRNQGGSDKNVMFVVRRDGSQQNDISD